MSNKLLLVARHILTMGLQKCLLSLKCKIHKFTVTAFHCEESTHWKEKQPRDLSDAGQKSRELTTPPEPPNTMKSKERYFLCHLYLENLSF